MSHKGRGEILTIGNKWRLLSDGHVLHATDGEASTRKQTTTASACQQAWRLGINNGGIGKAMGKDSEREEEEKSVDTFR